MSPRSVDPARHSPARSLPQSPFAKVHRSDPVARASRDVERACDGGNRRGHHIQTDVELVSRLRLPLPDSRVSDLASSLRPDELG